MESRNKGIELFRMIAAIMVVAIHTFPFQSISPMLDEVVTLTLFRVAVPYFFMVTGYFLLGKYSLDTSFLNRQKVKLFLIKILKIYSFVILLYLPLSIINGTITAKTSLLTWLKLIIFDGTFYHLWYFPGIILGVALVSISLNLFGFKKTGILAILLYIIGLGGDSWYGVLSFNPVVETFYTFIFKFMSYTRTGFFFAPLFLCLGIYLYQNQEWIKKSSSRLLSILGLLTILLLMESMTLGKIFEKRHDSMYLFLPFVMLILFTLILKWQSKKEVKNLSSLALVVYIIHPIVIVVVHYISNYIFILKNSVLYFLVVLVISILCAKVILDIYKSLSLKNKIEPESIRATKNISQVAIKHNVQEIAKVIPDNTKIMAVVKANAYGCDMITYAKELRKNKISFFAVATLAEAVKLRRSGITGEILILGYTQPEQIEIIKKYNLIQSIVSVEHARGLSRQKTLIRCHLQIDTGMHRLGATPEIEILKSIYKLPNLSIEGIYSHLGSSDSLDSKSVQRTENQIKLFNDLLAKLKLEKIDYGVTHIQSSYGILNYPDLAYDYVRVGIILYGYYSQKDDEVKTKIDLKPVLEVTSELVLKRTVEAGEYVGYGLETKLSKQTTIGVVSIGYADGLPRSLSSKEFNLSFDGVKLPVVGRICMDMLLVDLSEIKDIKVGDQVIVYNDIEDVAEKVDTISNEVLSQLGARLGTKVY